jgi:putative oxygen-independent coproporphyrinogen III oxidase
MLPGIYVHLPFCVVHCTYCDFPLTTRGSLAGEYHGALLKEIRMKPATRGDSLYFGGGTPSLTSPERIREIISHFVLTPEAEITLEANPDDVSSERLCEWAQLGINRLSLGVQSLEEPALHAMNRNHTAAMALQAMHHIVNAHFENWSVDLMIGTPGQTVAGFRDGLALIIELDPKHVSLYFLEVHEKTAMAKQLLEGQVQQMGEEDQLICYQSAIALLASAGLQHYEVSNFARSGYASRHNLKYWSNAPYYAYGAGASGYVDSVRTRNLAGVEAYIAALREDRLPLESSFSEDPDTIMRNAMIFGLRKVSGIALPEFQQQFGVSALSLFREGADDFLRLGLLEIDDNHLRLTLPGMLVSNEILSRIV